MLLAAGAPRRRYCSNLSVNTDKEESQWYGVVAVVVVVKVVLVMDVQCGPRKSVSLCFAGAEDISTD